MPVAILAAGKSSALGKPHSGRFEAAAGLFGVRALAWAYSQLKQPFLCGTLRNGGYACMSKLRWPVYAWLLDALRVGLSAFLLLSFHADAAQSSSSSADPNADVAAPSSLAWSLGVSRALRVAWQRPADAAAEVLLAACIYHNGWFGVDDGGAAAAVGGSAQLEYPIVLLLCGLAWSRARELVLKVNFLSAVLITSWTSKGQRSSFSPVVHVLLTLVS